MKSFDKKDSLNKKREAALKKNLKKRKKYKSLTKVKYNVSSLRKMDKKNSQKGHDPTFCQQTNKKR